ncbi:hypothetical protein K1T35_39565 [Pseudonocardia sp. DSM 110487]|uniref:hypothetical protein n=1 Tax=Pseudonocardia sp. DSM 110487 TaxID=2865833 RepID=UPI001C6983B0|nr:hypothetical protein [Pseudonocardia sp. DSM 110487]QYN34444.1 hypothetical protein K1T35_39565 [Pseudonocardia sp. DSM 110487]
MKVLSPSMFVAIFGELRSHRWITSDALTEDAYSFFASRAELMGWSRQDGSGLWGMNDASFDLSASNPRIAWFQVGLDERTVDGASFPFYSLLACGCDVLGRIGEITVRAAQFLVPVQMGGTPAAISSVPNWFNACDPAARVSMRVTLDSGEDPVLPQVAVNVAELASRIAREPFAIAPAAGTTHVRLLPEVTDGFWLGDSRHPVTFDTVAPDWSADSIAWTANLLTESCRRVGVKTSILINIDRAEG